MKQECQMIANNRMQSVKSTPKDVDAYFNHGSTNAWETAEKNQDNTSRIDRYIYITNEFIRT